MIITYLRSSSYNQWDMCPFSYFLTYTLGMPSRSGKAADLGNIVHKVQQCVASRKLAIQTGNQFFSDNELKEEFPVDVKIEDLIEKSWTYYVNGPANFHAWTKADKKKAYSLVYDANHYQDGAYNPDNLDIVAVEKYFDFTIDEPWAKYEYVDDQGKTVEGQLGIKGTMDLLHKHSNKVLCMQDYKTGRRWKWDQDKEKTLDDMEKDFQCLLYAYAIGKMYPEYKTLCLTFFYISDGGPYHIVRENGDNKKVLEMIKKRFEVIKKNKMPKRNLSWKCKSFCFWGKNKDEGSELTICDSKYQELQDIGLEKITKKYRDEGTVNEYAGGGVTNYKKDE